MAVLVLLAVGSVSLLAGLLVTGTVTAAKEPVVLRTTTTTTAPTTTTTTNAPTTTSAPSTPSSMAAAETTTTTETTTTVTTTTEASTTAQPIATLSAPVDDATIFATATQPSELCANQILIFGASASDDSVLVAICADETGIDYLGLELPRRAGIRVDACQADGGLWLADNSGWTYKVQSSGGGAGTGVSLTSPGGVRQFAYELPDVIGDTAVRPEFAC